MPALITDTGVAVVDSTCICDYLGEVGGGRRLVPQQGAERLRTLRQYGLGRGLIVAAFAATIERRFRDTASELRRCTRDALSVSPVTRH